MGCTEGRPITFYKHDGTNYAATYPLYDITLFSGANCQDLSANRDLSIVAVVTELPDLQVFVYNTTNSAYDLFSTYAITNIVFDLI